MLPKEGHNKFSIPSKLEAIYENFKFITETASYRVFEAQTRKSHEKHSIRILDPTKDLIDNNFDWAAVLFIQELFHLHTRCPGSVLIHTLDISRDISRDRKQIACATRLSGLLSLQLGEIQQFIDLKSHMVIEKLLNDVISDIEFLWRDLRMKNIASIIEIANIYYLKEKGNFFLGNWDKIMNEDIESPQDLASTAMTLEEPELRSQDLAAEIRALGNALLKIKKLDIVELESLQSMKKNEISTYEPVVKSIVVEGFNGSQKLQNLIERMLSLDPTNLPKLEEFKMTEDKIPVPFEKANNEANTEKKNVVNQIATEESKIDLSSATRSDTALSSSENPLGGMGLHYLIGSGNPGSGMEDVVTEVAYDYNRKLAKGITIAYCNLFDETNSGDFGPYLHTSDTASEYNEGQIDPKGPGWNKNLKAQFERRKASGFEYIELDNPDAYEISNVLGAVDLALTFGLKVIAKNPGLLGSGAKKYIAHPNIYGIIVEKDAGTPAKMDDLRKAASKPELPVWFVSFGKGKAWAETIAKAAKKYKNMGVTYSTKGEYGSTTDLVKP